MVVTARESGAEERGGVSTRLLLAVMVTAVFISVFNQAMVNVVVPAIQDQFGVSEGQVGWVVTGYLLVFAVGIPLYGRISDLFSLRRTFCFGLIVFAAGSLLCALAPSLTVLVGGRVLQSAGAAAIPALAFGSVAKVLPPGQRGVALGLLSSSVGIGAAAGPVLGGLLAAVAGWQSLFYGTLALVLVLTAGALYVLPDEVSGDAGGSRKGSDSSIKKLDLPGGTLLALAAGLSLFGVTEAEAAGISSPLVWGSLLVAVLSAAGFAGRIRRAPEPFVSPELFRNRAFVAAALVGFLALLANLGSLFLAPLLLTETEGFSILAAGLALAPGAVAVAALSPLAGRLSDRLGPRRVIFGGLAVMLSSALFISSYAAGRSIYMVAAGILILGIGFAGVNSPVANAASAVLSRSSAGVGLGVYQLFFFLGGGFGPALTGAFLALRQGQGSDALNPLYSFGGAPFSDAFLVVAGALLIALLAAAGIGGKPGAPETD